MIPIGPYCSQQFTTASQIQPQPSYILQIQVNNCNCVDGRLEIATQSRNSPSVEYRIVGLRDWSSNSVFQTPIWQRKGLVFSIDVRQSWPLISQQFTTIRPSSAKIAATLEEASSGLIMHIVPNPVSDQLRAELFAPAGIPVDVVIVTISGQILQQQAQGTDNLQVLSFDVSQQPSEKFVDRAITANQNRAAPGLKQ